jgi:hypothetical protein
MPLKIICELEEYPGRFRITNFSSEAATLFLDIRKSFFGANRHGAAKLKQPTDQNY